MSNLEIDFCLFVCLSSVLTQQLLSVHTTLGRTLKTLLVSAWPAVILDASCSGVLWTQNSQLTNVLPLNPGVGQNITTHALPTVRNFFPELVLPSRSTQLHFFLFFFIFSPYVLAPLVGVHETLRGEKIILLLFYFHQG